MKLDNSRWALFRASRESPAGPAVASTGLVDGGVSSLAVRSAIVSAGLSSIAVDVTE